MTQFSKESANLTSLDTLYHDNVSVSDDLSTYKAMTKVSSRSPFFCSACFEITYRMQSVSSLTHVSLACASQTHIGIHVIPKFADSLATK